MANDDRVRIAVIGAGVSGLTAAYLLRRRYDVTLFEADARLGGHADTHDITDSVGRTLAIDTGFIVHNDRTYPYLRRLFAELGVQTAPTEMSMSVRCLGCGLEYAGARKLGGVFAQPRSAANPSFLATLAQIPRFHRRARGLLADAGAGDGPTLREFLRAGHFTGHFVHHFAYPLVSAVWSCGPELAADYPARYLFRFLSHHGMLSVSGSPAWQTVVGGSRTYVERAAKELAAVRTSTPVRAVRRTGGGVEVHDDDDQVARFAGAVVATHPDQALRLLAAPSDAERDVLGAFRYSVNPTVLHTDASVLPSAPRARASWNYTLPSCRPAPGAVRVSYDLTRLQRLETPDRFVVTLNDDGGNGTGVDPATVLRRMSYQHPIYTPTSVAAQSRLPELNRDRIAYAGAYHGWGFHEDGCRSGVAAAAHFGIES
ncbi:MAG TPA: FAD-dependent oxidoreductase [Micromonosporaceae bacterium]|jgi:predicted NAD/FAD-binding protein